MKKMIVALIIILAIAVLYRLMFSNTINKRQGPNQVYQKRLYKNRKTGKNVRFSKKPQKIVKEKKNEGPSKTDKKILEKTGKKDDKQYDKKDPKRLTDQELERMEVYFEQTENMWRKEMENLIVNELGLGHEVMTEYENIVEMYHRERMEAFQEFHEYMEDRFGEYYSYSPDRDEEMFDDQIKDEYQERIRNLLGETGYYRYQEIINNFNERINSDKSAEIGVMQIDL